jgi:histone demethylase JARID1
MLYFGMAFSSFAWHVEDQFLYSINFHHTGSPKVWYGVGSDHADGLERVMKSELPELFEKHPDLMHQLVTSISPADLRRANIPVCKTLQYPGEFVVTFPRGYHCGFNAGFNLAEAVNFAMPDWIAAGVDAISNYKITRRHSAFSHHELMLAVARSFPVTQVALHLLQEMYRMIKEYDSLRHAVYAQGVNQYMRSMESPAILSCHTCLTDCYFSCVKCFCDSSKQACLACVSEMDWCKGACQGKYLLERVPMSVLESLVKKLEARLQLPKLCLLRGCPDCVPDTGSKRVALRNSFWLDPTGKGRRVLTRQRKAARQGGLRVDFAVSAGTLRPMRQVLFCSADPKKSGTVVSKRRLFEQPASKKARVVIDLT